MKQQLIHSAQYIKAHVFNSDKAYGMATFTVAALFATFVPEMSAVAQSAADSGFGAGICAAVEIVTSDAGKAIATAAIITIAIGALLGRVSWGMAVMIAAGIAGIFAAPQIAAWIASESGDSTGTTGFC
jgi:type IV secretory pathway VirB2 component (pilin)